MDDEYKDGNEDEKLSIETEKIEQAELERAFEDINFRDLESRDINKNIAVLQEIIACVEGGAHPTGICKNAMLVILKFCKSDDSIPRSLFALEILYKYISKDDQSAQLMYSEELVMMLKNILFNFPDVEKFILAFQCLESLTHNKPNISSKIPPDIIFEIINHGLNLCSDENFPKQKETLYLCLSMLSSTLCLQFPQELLLQLISNVNNYIPFLMQELPVIFLDFVGNSYKYNDDMAFTNYSSSEFLDEVADKIDDSVNLDIAILKLIKTIAESFNNSAPLLVSSSFFSKFSCIDCLSEEESNPEIDEFIKLNYKTLASIVAIFNQVKINFEDQSLVEAAVENIETYWPQIVSGAINAIKKSPLSIHKEIVFYITEILEVGGAVRLHTLCGNNELVATLADTTGTDIKLDKKIIKAFVNLSEYHPDEIGASLQQKKYFLEVFNNEEFRNKIDELEENYIDDKEFCQYVDILKENVAKLNEEESNSDFGLNFPFENETITINL